MAKIEFSGIDDIQDQLRKRSEATTRAVPAMLKAGAAVVTAAQQEQARVMFKGDRSTGDLAASIKAGSIKGDEIEKYIEVYPHGKDRHGVSNATKGFVQQYGRSNMLARPWMTAANEKCADEVNAAMRQEWEAAHNGG
ncbi:hypothetical protein UNSWDHB_2652 [Dehalobacter sp. UNSWDHB]|uniref:HK97-gp10 family putative phage morphogenesis protein n=1 Tax=Dehalobacter sp. UNSWDHB TaxID=1339256 RepID=UPI0003878E28|nr:HK97-gp10 family putative phage morphogenesis protein [Dehalobacter sp. UNSWDHB]EQB20066.1 hypothetical protein UNSWDHB_2652 [Dehalobacter sp. UNSWDHB]